MARRMPLPTLWRMTGADGGARNCSLPCSLAPLVGAEAATLSVDVPFFGWADQYIELELEGLYGDGWVEVEGRKCAEFSGLHGGLFRVDVTALIMPEMEQLAVRVHFAEGKGLRGVLEGAWLHGYSRLLIAGMSVRTDSDGTAFGVRCEVSAMVEGHYTFSYAVALGDESIGTLRYEEDLKVGTQIRVHKLAIAGAHLWRVGRSNRPYTIKLTVLAQHVGCDARQLRTGLLLLGVAKRTTEFHETLETLGNRPAFLEGTTWDAPEGDLMPEEKLCAILAQLEQAHIKSLFVPRPQCAYFYEACSAVGMMVWQLLPGDVSQAQQVIMRLMRHPCVVQWGVAPDGTDAAVRGITDILDTIGDPRPFVGPTPQRIGGHPDWKALGHGKCFNVVGPYQQLDPEILARYANDDDAVIRVLPQVVLGYVEDEAEEWFLQSGPWDEDTLAGLTEYLYAEQLRYFAERARFRSAVGYFGGRVAAADASAEGTLIDADGDPTLPLFALKQAFSPVAACVQMPSLAFWAHSAMALTVQLLVTAQLRDHEPVSVHAALHRISGEVLVEGKWDEVPCQTGEVGVLRATAPNAEEPLVLRLTVTRGEQTLFRGDRAICVGTRAMLAALLSAPVAKLGLRDGRIVNIGPVAAFSVASNGVQDEAFSGWGALLPGEQWELRERASLSLWCAQVQKLRQ